MDEPITEIRDGDTTWRFDHAFLTSNWTCIWGRGCLGILDEPAAELGQGCCSVGAELDSDDEARRIAALADTLEPARFQHHAAAREAGIFFGAGRRATRVVDGACIFLNRPGFPAGPGCALHKAAEAQGRSHVDLKPEVCWQLPLRREDQVEDDGHVVSTVRQWDRRHWGKGGEEFHWWCTEDPEAFVGTKPVYEEMQAELTEMVGETVFSRLMGYLRQRDRLREQRVALPHPAVRYRKTTPQTAETTAIEAPAIEAPAIDTPALQMAEAPAMHDGTADAPGETRPAPSDNAAYPAE
jgi:hypothetical protein